MSRLTSSPVVTTSWHGARRDDRGRDVGQLGELEGQLRELRAGSTGHASVTSSAMARAWSSMSSTPRASDMRARDPNALMSRGNGEPPTSSKSSAGPPSLVTRSAIAETSGTGRPGEDADELRALLQSPNERAHAVPRHRVRTLRTFKII